MHQILIMLISFQRALCPETEKCKKAMTFIKLEMTSSIYAEKPFLAYLLYLAIVFRKQT